MSTATTWYLESKTFETWAYIENFLDDDECIKVKEIAEDHIKEQAKIESGVVPEIRKNSVAFFNSGNPDYQWLYRKITDAVNSINKKFWDFDLEYIETLQYTEYGNIGDKYEAHLDIGHDYIHYRKLSFSILLDDPKDYEGGDFLIHSKGNPDVALKGKGTIIVFPSFMLHEVTPITTGSRASLVGWVCGPKFR